MSAIIQFPSNTLPSKLQSKSLKKPPKPIDWIQQSYMEMIEDNILFSTQFPPIQGQIRPKEEHQQTITIHLNEQKAYTHISTIKIQENPCLVDSQLDEEDLIKEEKEKDDISDCGYTQTTSSTDYNRKNNVFQFYKEQQQHRVCPIDEEVPYYKEDRSLNLANRLHQEKKLPVKSNKYKKFKLIGKIISDKMRLTAEKPFWSINDHF